jgi:phosphoribosylformylglycinamidine cyclo-ligase
MGITYRDSGVDIDKGDRFVDIIRKKLKKGEQENIGLFGGLFELDLTGYRNPVLVAGADGIGTKLLLAKEAQNFRTIGIDLVAMCVNDIITLGARPLFFLDYIATADFDLDTGSQIIEGIIEGCRCSACRLLGGETAEMPGVYAKGDYELAGFAVGIVDRSEVIDGNSVQEGDLLVGLRSSGIHSNGLSLARRALFGRGKYVYASKHVLLQKTLVEELLTPTRIYVETVIDILKRVQIRGIAHITGGGFEGNVTRLLPNGLGIEIFWDEFDPHPIFTVIQRAGEVDLEEMRKTFNMGVGMVLIVRKEEAEPLIAMLRERGEEPRIVGRVRSSLYRKGK